MASPSFQATPTLSCRYLEEPLLSFADGQQHIDPKIGIARFGPKSLRTAKRHPNVVKVGFIGTATTIEQTQEWLSVNCSGIPGDESHPAFPGCMKDRGFHTELDLSGGWTEQITRAELDRLLAIKTPRERFDATLHLLDEKLAGLSQKDLVPDYIVLAIPDTLRKKAGVLDMHCPQLGRFHRDLRRAFKGVAMKYRIPTQLVDEATMDFRDPDHPTKIAWNLFTGLYFKSGGMPWGPTALTPGSCYVGVSFYRGLHSTDPSIHTSLVQAFDEHGEGLVLRGPDVTWDSEAHHTRTPHLNAEKAFELVEVVLAKYKLEMKQLPTRIVIHKSSRWWQEEAAGIRAALDNRGIRYDLVALKSQSAVRLLPISTYPALRGTRFTIGELDYLYTTGYISELRQFHGVHVPSPIQIADHIGYDTPREVILREILTLTKMNWNAARLGGLFPITLKFARLVGEIMREIPPGVDPLPQSKYYM
jgi:hypothetical protein